MTLYEIVKKLVGEINPVGAEHIDKPRFENLEVMTDLVDKLIFDIDDVASYRDRGENSMKRAGEFADKFLDSIEQKELK